MMKWVQTIQIKQAKIVEKSGKQIYVNLSDEIYLLTEKIN